MAADLYIHSMTTAFRKADGTPEGLTYREFSRSDGSKYGWSEGHSDVTEDDFRCFFASTLGSKYFDISGQRECSTPFISECSHWANVYCSDKLYIGEVSWLKAGLTGDDNYIPDPCGKIHELIGENQPELDGALAEAIIGALAGGDSKQNPYDVVEASNPEVTEWLRAHVGHKLFTVSW